MLHQEVVDAMMYHQMIGSLMYLTNTRPDICFAINTLRHVHLMVAKHVVPKGYSWLWAQVWGKWKDYVDSYWVGSAIDRKTNSRCYFSMRSGVISWFSRKESCVALSTAEEKDVSTCYLGGSMIFLKNTIWFGWYDLHFCMMKRGAVIQIEISRKRDF